MRLPSPRSRPGSLARSGGAHRSGVPAAESPSVSSELEVALAERTADLQRLQAEYVNYKRRVDRDRELTRETAIASVLMQLLPVLDDIGRARDHDELTGGFKAVADSLERTTSGLGLETFGEVGDAFDPRIHEALMHSYTDDVDGPVCRPSFRSATGSASGSSAPPESPSPSRHRAVRVATMSLPRRVRPQRRRIAPLRPAPAQQRRIAPPSQPAIRHTTLTTTEARSIGSRRGGVRIDESR